MAWHRTVEWTFIWINSLLTHIWGLWCQKQVSQAGISNCIPQFTVGCNYLSLPEIPASGNNVLIYASLDPDQVFRDCFKTHKLSALNGKNIYIRLLLKLAGIRPAATLCSDQWKAFVLQEPNLQDQRPKERARTLRTKTLHTSGQRLVRSDHYLPCLLYQWHLWQFPGRKLARQGRWGKGEWPFSNVECSWGKRFDIAWGPIDKVGIEFSIDPKFDRRIDSSAAEAPAKFQSYMEMSTPSPAGFEAQPYFIYKTSYAISNTYIHISLLYLGANALP